VHTTQRINMRLYKQCLQLRLEVGHGGDHPFGHHLELPQRGPIGYPTVRDLDAQLGELMQVLDRLVNPFTVLSDIEAQLHRLFDVGIVAPGLRRGIPSTQDCRRSGLRGALDGTQVLQPHLSLGHQPFGVVSDANLPQLL